mmetsp:Transcript_12309/g.14839  ORF Transcript_12309/g.14839 Transcript_12309/m.14839 type:complete len:203 (+) Transcript_12309:665-1273(+)
MNKFLSIKITHVLHHVLINRINKVENFNILFVELFHELTLFKLFNFRTGNNVNVLLPILHSFNILLQTDEIFLFSQRRVETKKFCKFTAVWFIFNTSKLDTGSKLLVPGNVRMLLLFLRGGILNDISISIDLSLGGIVVFFLNLLLGKITDHFDGLSHKFLFDNLDNLAFLKSFTIDIEGKILGINNTLNKGKVSGHKFKLI